MQLWPIRSCGFFGSGRLAEIGRRADDRHAYVRPDAHRDHVLRQMFAGSTPASKRSATMSVRPYSTLISTLMSGYRRRNRHEFRPQDGVGRVVGGGDANRAGGLLAQLAQRRELGVDLLEPGAEAVRAGARPLRSARRCAWCAREAERRAGLELADGVAQRRLRNAELRRGFGETALPPDRQEGQEIIQVSALHLSRPLISPCGL